MISEDRFTSIFKYLPSPGIVLLPDDPKLTILAANDAYLSLCNMREAEVVGKGYFEVFPEHADSAHSVLRASFSKVLSEKRKDFFPLRGCDIYRRNGGISDDRYLQIENIPIPDTTGNISYILHVINDITDAIDTAVRMKRTRNLEHLEREVLELYFRKNFSMNDLLTYYLKGIESLFPDMQCSILRVKEEHLHMWSAPSLPAEYVSATHRLPIHDHVGSCGTAAYLKKMVIVRDIANDIRWKDYKDIALQYNLRACWSYPIIDAEGKVMATFGIYYQEVKEPGAEELNIIDKATSILKIILENGQYIEKLQLSESRLRSLVDSQTNYVIRTDIYGYYTYYNKKYDDDFGWLHPEGSLIGSDSMQSVLPHHHKRVTDTTERCRLHPNKVYTVELDKYRRDGQAKSTIWHFICLTDMSGNPAEIQCIGIDNTERKRAQDELKASHKRYRELFHLSPQPMWVYELDTLKFLDVNEAAIKHYGYSRKEFLSMDLLAIRKEEDKPSLFQAVEKMKKNSGAIHHGVFKHQKKNGESIYVDMRSNVLSYKGKVAYLALANDITERLHYVNAIEDQNKRFKAIAWMQSHVLRAPVARIMSLADLLNNHQNTEAEREELINYILESAHELDKIVKEISEQTHH